MTKHSPDRPRFSQLVVFGTSAEPPHYGHLAMLLLAAERCPSAQFALMPSLDRWDKSPGLSLLQRSQLAECFADECRQRGLPVWVDGREGAWGLPFQGSLLTLKSFEADEAPPQNIALLCGEDSWDSMPFWRNSRTQEINGQRIPSEFSVWVVPRWSGGAHGSKLVAGGVLESNDPFALGLQVLPRISEAPSTLKRLRDFGCFENPSPFSSSKIRSFRDQGQSLNTFSFSSVVTLFLALSKLGNGIEGA